VDRGGDDCPVETECREEVEVSGTGNATSIEQFLPIRVSEPFEAACVKAAHPVPTAPTSRTMAPEKFQDTACRRRFRGSPPDGITFPPRVSTERRPPG